MLDVHPPHAPTHTWRDFFIHIATIVVGLVIAVGLEQGVEWLHHREQLHRLREDLHSECVHNLHLALNDIEYCERYQVYGVSKYTEIVRAHHDRRSPSFTDSPVASFYLKPAYGVWTVAQQRGTLGLLPSEEMQNYVRLYSTLDQASEILPTLTAAASKLRAALAPGKTTFTVAQRNQDPREQDDAAWANLDDVDFREARNALAQLNQAERFGLDRNLLLYTTVWSILRNSHSDDKMMLQAYRDANAAYRAGGEAALLARFPLPNDANHLPDGPDQSPLNRPAEER